LSTQSVRLAFVAVAAAVVSTTSFFDHLLGNREFLLVNETEPVVAAGDTAVFLSQRNQVTIVVPRDMRRDEFVALYRLEHVREHIPETLSGGQSITVPLTPKTEVPIVPR